MRASRRRGCRYLHRGSFKRRIVHKTLPPSFYPRDGKSLSKELKDISSTRMDFGSHHMSSWKLGRFKLIPFYQILVGKGSVSSVFSHFVLPHGISQQAVLLVDATPTARQIYEFIFTITAEGHVVQHGDPEPHGVGGPGLWLPAQCINKDAIEHSWGVEHSSDVANADGRTDCRNS